MTDKLDDLAGIDQVLKLSAEHDVEFLPPSASE